MRIRLDFTVGTTEVHEVTFRFNKFWGGLSVEVDGVRVLSEIRTVSVDLTTTWWLHVGASEVHEVVIEKRRKRLLAGFRPQPVRALVDGRLVAEGVA